MVNIGNEWDELLKDEWEKPYYLKLRAWLSAEYGRAEVYPQAKDIFNAFKLTPYNAVKAVILGQDPYHEPGQAQGLSFSVPRSMKLPPSLVNIIRELNEDRGWRTPVSAVGQELQDSAWTAGYAVKPEMSGAARTAGCDEGPGAPGVARSGLAEDLDGILVPWAIEGVMLLNSVLTVRAHAAGSHRGHGWEMFTDRVIELLAEREQPMVFILWGSYARSKKEIIKGAQQAGGEIRHLIIEAPHPSPLSAHRGFFGGRYFSRTNYFLEDNNITPINWEL